MSYRLEKDEPLTIGIRRIAHEQFDKAERSLAVGDADIHEGIHDARKRCKKIRALVRLVREPMGSEASRSNRQLRDAAKLLSDVRDSTALLETVDDLAADTGDAIGTDPLERLRRNLASRRLELVTRIDLHGRVRALKEQMADCRSRVDTWPLPDDADCDAILPGLKRTYKRGYKAMDQARDGAGETVHEWRKRAKYLWYHVRILRPLWPKVMKAWRKELKQLGSALGDHHDLAVLQQVLDDMPDDVCGDRKDRARVRAAMVERQQRLLNAALPAGERIYAEKPSDFCDRIEAWWRALEHEGGLLAAPMARAD